MSIDTPSRSAAAFFDSIAGRYERCYCLETGESRRRMAWVLSVLPPPPLRLLDLGVGTGREIPFLLDGGHQVTGLDASTAMLERCARRARPVPLVHADFWESLPFEDASFDAAIALHGTLAHAPDEGDLGRLSAELARITVAGAVWVTEIPSPAWLDRIGCGVASEGCVVRRTGTQTCVYEDSVTSTSIEVRLPAEQEWRAALAPQWDVEIAGMGLDPFEGNRTAAGEDLLSDHVEWRVVARRR
ncbi:MAG: class I SAM-dependent methyltransferase [Polyangiaceae bacterium]